MELTIENLIKKYQNSSQKWILPIPVIQDGQLKLICYMNRNEDGAMEFNAQYIYNINLLVLLNYMMETSNGQAYWKYVRGKEPRTSFLELDSEKHTYVSEQDVYEVMRKGQTKYILNLINKKFNEINYVFSIIALNEAKEQEDELANMGYDY